MTDAAVSNSERSDRRVRAAESGSWRVAPGWHERLEEIRSVDWFRLERNPHAEAVKANPNRQVWRMRLGQTSVYVKTYRPAGWDDRIRCLIRGGPPPQAEWRAGLYAEREGVPCHPLVACGIFKEPMGGSAAVLITEEVRDAVSIREAWWRTDEIVDLSSRRKTRLGLVAAVASLLARAHEARFLHRDGHAGNILVRTLQDGAAEALYTDLYGASYGATLTEGEAAWSLAQLNQWFGRHASRSTRARFLRIYLRQRMGNAAAHQRALRHWATLVENASRINAQALYRKRDRRMKRRGKYFARLQVDDGRRALVVLRFRNRPEFPRPIHPNRTPKEWLGLLNAEALSGSQTDVPDADAEEWCASGILESLRWGLGGSPARRAFRLAHGIRHRDLPCRWALAAVERRGSLRCTHCRLLTEKRPHADSLATLLSGGGRLAERWGDRAWRAKALECTGRLLAEAALRGVEWPDVDPKAVLLECPPETDGPSAMFGRIGAGVTFGRLTNPNVDATTLGAARLALRLEEAPAGTAADARTLLDAYRRRLGRRFRPGADWPAFENQP